MPRGAVGGAWWARRRAVRPRRPTARCCCSDSIPCFVCETKLVKLQLPERALGQR